MNIKSVLPIVLVIFGALTLSSGRAHAAITWSEIRIFGTNNMLANTPTALNAMSAPDSVPYLGSLPGLGIEADARIAQLLKVGTRFRGIWALNSPENGPNPPVAFRAVQQAQGGVFFRIPLIDQDWLWLDAFGEVGVENTHIDVKTVSSGQGTYTRESSFYQRAGGAVGIGWSSIKFFVEAGQEWNFLDNLSFAGTLTNGSSLKSIDLSGPYFAFGVIISGVPGWIKPGGVSTK